MSGEEVNMGIDCEETCKCGITYQTWLVYDVECIDDKVHVWED
jgi:hypothetical protein